MRLGRGCATGRTRKGLPRGAGRVLCPGWGPRPSAGCLPGRDAVACRPAKIPRICSRRSLLPGLPRGCCSREVASFLREREPRPQGPVPGRPVRRLPRRGGFRGPAGRARRRGSGARAESSGMPELPRPPCGRDGCRPGGALPGRPWSRRRSRSCLPVLPRCSRAR